MSEEPTTVRHDGEQPGEPITVRHVGPVLGGLTAEDADWLVEHLERKQKRPPGTKELLVLGKLRQMGSSS